jgi:hypothetical protein
MNNDVAHGVLLNRANQKPAHQKLDSGQIYLIHPPQFFGKDIGKALIAVGIIPA